MKSHHLVPLVILLASAPAQADVYFKGKLVILATLNCPDGPNIGNREDTIYHPNDVAGNQNFSALNTFDDGGAINRQIAGGFTSTLQATTTRGIGWADYTASRQASVSVTSRTPGSLTSSTGIVSLTGKIRNFSGDEGVAYENCIVDYAFNGVKG